MRSHAATAALVALVCASTATASRTLVPASMQQDIVRRARTLAYVPTRAPTGFRFAGWSYTPKPAALHVSLRNRAGWGVVFTASRQVGPCATDKAKTFQLSGNRVYWRQRDDGRQEAWRCVRGTDGRPVRLSATISVAPNRFAPAGVGLVATAARRIP